jgi:hypothetical protein
MSVYDLNAVSKKLREARPARQPEPTSAYDLEGAHALLRHAKANGSGESSLSPRPSPYDAGVDRRAQSRKAKIGRR